MDNFLSYCRFASSVWKEHGLFISTWSPVSFCFHHFRVCYQYTQKLKAMFFQSMTLICSLDQHCSYPSLTYYCPELCTAVFQCYTSWKFDIEICDTNCQLGVGKKISSSLINIKLLGENVLLKQAFLLGMKESIYYYWHDNWNHIQQNDGEEIIPMHSKRRDKDTSEGGKVCHHKICKDSDILIKIL